MIVLAVDTTAPVIGVAASDGLRTFSRVGRVERGAEAVLVEWSCEALAALGASLRDVAGVGVAMGPGTFTGTRVGLAHGLGIGIANGAQMWPGDGLACRARAVGGTMSVLTLLDARRGRAYASAFSPDGTCTHAAADAPLSDALGWMVAPFVATGEGALLWKDDVERAGGCVAQNADDPAVHVLVADSFATISAGQGVPVSRMTPRYLRAPGVEAR